MVGFKYPIHAPCAWTEVLEGGPRGGQSSSMAVHFGLLGQQPWKSGFPWHLPTIVILLSLIPAGEQQLVPTRWGQGGRRALLVHRPKEPEMVWFHSTELKPSWSNTLLWWFVNLDYAGPQNSLASCQMLLCQEKNQNKTLNEPLQFFITEGTWSWDSHVF